MNLRQTLSTATTRMAPLTRFASAVPARVWIAAAALLFAGLWLQEHDARVRRQLEAEQAARQASTAIAALKLKSDAALRQANQQNATVVANLEAQRHKLAARGDALAAQLATLKKQQQQRAQEIAALPPDEVSKRLIDQLSPASFVATTQPTATTGAQQTLTPGGQRKVLAALGERDSCRAQLAVAESQFTNCRDQLAASAAEIKTQADSLAKLNQALAAKDAIQKQREAEFNAQLRAARGTWHSRLFRALKYFAAGAALGAALR